MKYSNERIAGASCNSHRHTAVHDDGSLCVRALSLGFHTAILAFVQRAGRLGTGLPVWSRGDLNGPLPLLHQGFHTNPNKRFRVRSWRNSWRRSRYNRRHRHDRFVNAPRPRKPALARHHLFRCIRRTSCWCADRNDVRREPRALCESDRAMRLWGPALGNRRAATQSSLCGVHYAPERSRTPKTSVWSGESSRRNPSFFAIACISKFSRSILRRMRPMPSRRATSIRRFKSSEPRPRR